MSPPYSARQDLMTSDAIVVYKELTFPDLESLAKLRWDVETS